MRQGWRKVDELRFRVSCDIRGGQSGGGRERDIDETLPLQNEFGSAELMGNSADSEEKS